MNDYDRWARGYDRRWRRYADVTLGRLLDQLDLRQYRDALDVGCGTGALLLRLLERRPDLHATGIDPSAGMLAVARAKLAGRGVDLRQGNAYSLPLPAHSVDLVMMANMLHYVARPSLACAEARRVLRPGGALAVVDYVPRGGLGSVADGLIRLYDHGHVRAHGLPDLRAILTHAGFDVTHAERFPIDRFCDGVLAIGALTVK
jgi:ubiquinone/menaquinone biosynthesis C-methylase UbiE